MWLNATNSAHFYMYIHHKRREMNWIKRRKKKELKKREYNRHRERKREHTLTKKRTNEVKNGNSERRTGRYGQIDDTFCIML